jgi:hypothetical protein
MERNQPGQIGAWHVCWLRCLVDWGNFNAPLRNDRANAPHMVQTAATINNTLATKFLMHQGWIKSFPTSGAVGTSIQPQPVNGPLIFYPIAPKDDNIHPFCIMVSAEKFVFFVTGLIMSHRI